MKKIIALLMALCLLMTAFAAIAEAPALVDARAIVQDEQPPKLVVTEGNVIAKICAADGTLLAEIAQDGTIHLCDVHHREELVDQKAIVRLDHAYDQLMHDVHFGDVKTAEGEKLLKELIDEKLAGGDLNAYDLLVYEVFDAHIDNPELAALLTDGAYVEFTVELLEDQGTPLMIKFSEDGEHWDLLDDFTVEGQQVTLRLTKPGVVGLIKPYEAIPGTEYVYVEEVVTTSTTTETGLYEASPAFTPSVTGKPAPQLVPYILENNEIVVGYIYHKDTTEPTRVTVEDHLVITPVSESFYVEDITTHEHLQWSYDAIREAGEIQNLTEDIGAAIDEQLAAQGSDLTHTDLVVRDLFEVTMYGDNIEMFYTEGNLLELTFEEKELDPTQPLVVLHSHDSINWHVAPAEQVMVNDNGTITLKLDGLGAVAFLVERGEELPSGDQAVSSPE